MDAPIRLSPSEKQTLAHLAGGGYQPWDLDWVAVQRLKKFGLAEDRSTGGVQITQEGLRLLKRLASSS